MNALPYILPEAILFVAAAALFLLGTSKNASARHVSPAVALIGLLAAFLASLYGPVPHDVVEHTGALALTGFATYVKTISTGVATLFVLLAWPTSRDGTANRSISFSTETGEYFALLLLAVAGMGIAAAANSLPTLFLGIELASIPTYIMVTMSRPHEAAQEGGVKYFFLGAAAAAIMVLGMSYLFGLTGEMRLDTLTEAVARLHTAGERPVLLTFALTLILASFLFKMAAVPLHFYAGDVYQGAATPVTAAISFIPKITGVAALLKILYVAGAGTWAIDHKLAQLLFVVAVATMTVGNVLGLLQYNVKRVLAYSSIAHSGYLLVGVAALAYLAGPDNADLRRQVLGGIAFYMLAYGIMNAAAFGVLQLLPSKLNQQATTAETYDDLAGAGRERPFLGLAMTLACLSLIGIPTTVGFFGKLYLIKPAVQSGQTALVWLAVLTMINATISAGYYLKIIATMWTRQNAGYEGPVGVTATLPAERSVPINVAIAVSCAGMLILGVVLPLSGGLYNKTTQVVASLLGT